MSHDTLLPFDLPSVGRKKLTIDFAGGNQSSDGGLLLLRATERKLRVCRRLAEAMPDETRPARDVRDGDGARVGDRVREPVNPVLHTAICLKAFDDGQWLLSVLEPPRTSGNTVPREIPTSVRWTCRPRMRH